MSGLFHLTPEIGMDPGDSTWQYDDMPFEYVTYDCQLGEHRRCDEHPIVVYCACGCHAPPRVLEEELAPHIELLWLTTPNLKAAPAVGSTGPLPRRKPFVAPPNPTSPR